MTGVQTCALPIYLSTDSTAIPTLGGDGGAVSANGDMNAAGSAGGFGHRVDGVVATSGVGAGSHYGGGANARKTSGNGNAAGNYGAGGGGAASIAVPTGYTGGAGSGGVIIVWEYSE